MLKVIICLCSYEWPPEERGPKSSYPKEQMNNSIPNNLQWSGSKRRSHGPTAVSATPLPVVIPIAGDSPQLTVRE